MPRVKIHRLFAVAAIVAVGAFAALAVFVPASAAAFGPLGHVAVGNHFPEPYNGLIQRHRAAFDAGATFPDLEELENVPSLIERLYRSFNPKDKYVAVGTRLHSLHLALDLLQQAETEEQAAFALGYVSHIAADMIFQQHFLQKKMSEYGHRMLDRDQARAIAEMMGELHLRKFADQALNSQRQRGLDIFTHFARVARSQPWGATISDVDFMNDVALHEFSTEMKINATGPGGSVARGLQRLNDWLPGIAGFTVASYFDDVEMFVALAAQATVSLIEQGYESPWVRDGWGLTNPYPQIAGAVHWPLRVAQQDALPEGIRSPNPGFVVCDAFFADADDARVDRCSPSACNPVIGDDSAPPTLRQFRAKLRLAAWQPIAGRLKLVVRAHHRNGNDPEIAEGTFDVNFTLGDVADGNVREFAVPFAFSPTQHGPFERAIFTDFTRGFYFVARFEFATEPANGDETGDETGDNDGTENGNTAQLSRSKWLTFFSTFAVRSQEIGGFDTYGDWPFSLEVNPEFDANSAQLDAGKFDAGKSNEAPRDRFAGNRPDGFAYRFPYALLSPEPSEIRVQTADERTLVGTLYRAQGSRRGVILLHPYPGNRHDYMYLQPKLRDAGFTSIAIDFRGKDNSGTPDDRAAYAARHPDLFNALDRDVAAAKHYLVEECGVDPRQIALVGGSVGCSAALRTAASDADFAAGVLLSPGLNYLGVDSAGDMPKWGARPLFMTFATRAPGEKEAVDALREMHAAPDAVRVEGVDADARRGHATRQFRVDPDLLDRLVAFLDRAVHPR